MIVFGIHNVLRIFFLLLYISTRNGGLLSHLKVRVKMAEKKRLALIKDYPSLSVSDVKTLKSLCCDYKSLIPSLL